MKVINCLSLSGLIFSLSAFATPTFNPGCSWAFDYNKFAKTECDEIKAINSSYQFDSAVQAGFKEITQADDSANGNPTAYCQLAYQHNVQLAQYLQTTLASVKAAAGK